MPAVAPQDRLTARDFYRLLDWLRDAWFEDEIVVAQQLVRLRRHFEHLPTRFWTQAEPLIKALGEARVFANRPWRQTIRELAEIASAWDRSRPPLLACERCGIEIRGHDRMRLHLSVVHEFEEGSEG